MEDSLKDELSEEITELYEHHRIEVDSGQSLLRIDKYITSRLSGISRTRIQNAAEAGNILVNSNPVKQNYRVKPNDIISVVLPFPPIEIQLIPQNISINITYEDDDILIVNKEPNMVVHPGKGNYDGTLINALLYHLKDLPGFDDGKLRPGLVHRIDKNTSGILVIAKNELALNKLAKQFFDRTIERRYIAIVWGSFNSNEGTITGNIGRSLKDRTKMDVFPDGEIGKHAITHYKVIEDLGEISVLECKLETGRTHQIRAHLSYIGHPIFSDATYGGNVLMKGNRFSKFPKFVENCFKIIPRQALHAKSLGFVHPTTNQFMFFDSDLPLDMQELLSKWRNKANLE